MTLVRRANVVLEVKDDAVDRMLSQGYSVIDASGKVLKRSTVKDVNNLTAIIKEQEAQIKALEDKCAKLEKELEEARKPKEVKKSTTQKKNSTKK